MPGMGKVAFPYSGESPSCHKYWVNAATKDQEITPKVSNYFQTCKTSFFRLKIEMLTFNGLQVNGGGGEVVPPPKLLGVWPWNFY